MSHDAKTTKGASIADDYEAVSEQLAALREDMARLSETVAAIANRRGGNMATDIADGFDEARRYAAKTGRSAEQEFEASVASHPLLAIALAAGAGLLVGAMSRR